MVYESNNSFAKDSSVAELCKVIDMEKRKVINPLKRKQAFAATSVNYKYGRKQFCSSQNPRRPARIVRKPKRYVTTSSSQDELQVISKKKVTEKPIDLQKDIDDIHNTSFEEHKENAANIAENVPNIAKSQKTIKPQNRIANRIIGSKSFQQNESQNDNKYRQLLSTPLTPLILAEPQPEVVASSNESYSFTEGVPQNNDSAVLNPLLHYRTLQHLPHVSGYTEGYSGTMQSPQRTCSAVWTATGAGISSSNCNSNSSQYQEQQHNRPNEFSFTQRDYHYEANAAQREPSAHWNAIIRELDTIKKRLEDMPTKQDFKVLDQKLIKLLKSRSAKMPTKPDCLPLESVEQVELFENIEEEHNDQVVAYLKFLGGQTVDESVKFCMKQIITDKALSNYSLWGEKDENIALYNKKLLSTVYVIFIETVASSPYFAKPDKKIFFEAVKEAIRFVKQRLRNAQKRVPGEKGRRTKRHEEADAIFGENKTENEN
ncbi:uncharacterized protein [Linepithema humile]|uniref:uncharacterized protein isoform X3 n=1 Tax=Linepithema humile TaxID=83485 RepID=UPI00351DE62D